MTKIIIFEQFYKERSSTAFLELPLHAWWCTYMPIISLRLCLFFFTLFFFFLFFWLHTFYSSSKFSGSSFCHLKSTIEPLYRTSHFCFCGFLFSTAEFPFSSFFIISTTSVISSIYESFYHTLLWFFKHGFLSYFNIFIIPAFKYLST